MPRPALQLAIAAPLAAVLAAGGCGAAKNSDSATKFQGEQRAVATVIEDFQKASEKSDEHKICRDLITAQLQLQITRANRATAKGCAQAVDDGLKDSDQADMTVTAVRLAGPVAVAVVKQKLSDKQNRSTTVGLRKVGGRWRISRLPAPAR